MITDLDIMAMFATCEAAGLRPPASYAKDQGLAAGIAIYVADLAHLNPGDLAPAIAKHRRDPERGRWWPTPADILAGAPRVDQLADPDEAKWVQIVARICAGEKTFAHMLDAAQGAGFAAAGGWWSVSRARDGVELATCRRRFLDTCKDSRSRSALAIAQGREPVQVVDASARFARLVDRSGGGQ